MPNLKKRYRTWVLVDVRKVQIVLLIVLTVTLFHGCKRKINKAKTIYEAAQNGDKASLIYFIEKGVSVNVRNKAGIAPLHFAALHGHVDIAEYLIDAGAELEIQDNIGMTPLHLSSAFGKKEIVELLLSRGANASARNKQGGTPLIAVTIGQGDSKEILKLLMRHGANVNTRMDDGATALHRAVMNGQPDILELLLLNGANPNTKNNMRQTPLDLALTYCQTTFRSSSEKSKMGARFQECVKILREHQKKE